MVYHVNSLIKYVIDFTLNWILPRINDKIERLNVEPSSMEQILRATNYPNLITLGLYHVAPETAIDKGETADFVLPGFPRFPGFLLYSQDSHRTPRIPTVFPGFPPYSQDSHCTPGIPIILPGFPLYSQDSHCTPGIPIVLPGFPL